jgi:hypothetical protein
MTEEVGPGIVVEVLFCTFSVIADSIGDINQMRNRLKAASTLLLAVGWLPPASCLAQETVPVPPTGPANIAVQSNSNQNASDSGVPKAYWGIEGGGGSVLFPRSLANSLQKSIAKAKDGVNSTLDNLTGPSFTTGIVRFHGDGSPSFSLDFIHYSLNAKATYQGGPAQYQGDAAISGFMASKHKNFAARRRFSVGMSFGAGVAPQLKANYTKTENGVVQPQKTYTLKQVPVTPLFEVLFRGEVRVHRNISIGPFAGVQDLIPMIGATVRVHFPGSKER